MLDVWWKNDGVALSLLSELTFGGALNCFVEAGHSVFVQGPCGIEMGPGYLRMVNSWSDMAVCTIRNWDRCY